MLLLDRYEPAFAIVIDRLGFYLFRFAESRSKFAQLKRRLCARALMILLYVSNDTGRFRKL